MSTHSTHLGRPLDEPSLDADTARATLRSMASVTRVILGVALQAPAEAETLAGPETLGAAAPAPSPAPVTLALPAEPEPEPEPELEPVADVVEREPRPAAYPAADDTDADWMPALAAVPRLAVVDPLPTAPERHNVGLLAELAFLDD